MRQPAATRKFLTTSEAAAMLKISVATLKRWAQAGLVASERTEGGHRRFSRAALEVLAAPPASGPTPAAGQADELLRSTTVAELAAFAVRGRRESGSWAVFGDTLRPAIIELHRRRQSGSITAVQWLASLERLRVALGGLADPLAPVAGRPSLLISTAPGDRLQHGAALGELVAAEAGWTPRIAGPATAHDLTVELAREAAAGVLVNASADMDPALLARLARELAEVGARNATPIALTGLGAWPEPAPGVVRLQAFAELRAWLDGIRQPHLPPPATAEVIGQAAPLAWDASLELGEPTIDAQHKVLFGTARRYAEAVRESATREETDQLFEFALDYISVHFRCEENLMRSRGYPYVEGHAWEHEQFARRVTEMAAKRDAPGAAEALASLLESWLRGHVTGADKKLGVWLRQQAAAR
ncbi:MAG: bacteriohemerythrin [Anaeromyxobacter sp.]